MAILGITKAAVEALILAQKLKIDAHINNTDAHGLADVRTRLTAAETGGGLGLVDFSLVLLADDFNRADGAIGSAPTGTKAGAWAAFPSTLPVIASNKAVSAAPGTPATLCGAYRDVATKEVLISADVDVSGGKTGSVYLDARVGAKSIAVIRRGSDNTLQIQQGGVTVLTLIIPAVGPERLALLVTGALARVAVNGQIVGSAAIDPSATAGYGNAAAFRVSGTSTVDNFSARAVVGY